MANLDAVLKPAWEKPVEKEGGLYCPKCGGRLVQRDKKREWFLGCSRYGMTGCDYTSPFTRMQQEAKWQVELAKLEMLEATIKGEKK